MWKLKNVRQSTGFIDKYVSALYNKSCNKGLGKLKQMMYCKLRYKVVQ